ncbi:MAG: hypothetical protein V3V61_07785 [Gammaproteobacteria bacterium]
MTYGQAKYVLMHGISALIQAMDQKALSVSLAAKIAKHPQAQQQDLLTWDRKKLYQMLQ